MSWSMSIYVYLKKYRSFWPCMWLSLMWPTTRFYVLGYRKFIFTNSVFFVVAGAAAFLQCMFEAFYFHSFSLAFVSKSLTIAMNQSISFIIIVGNKSSRRIMFFSLLLLILLVLLNPIGTALQFFKMKIPQLAWSLYNFVCNYFSLGQLSPALLKCNTYMHITETQTHTHIGRHTVFEV